MAGAMYHRGPDEFGAFRDARAGFCHARLSIIDLATGQQPLTNEDDSLWIVFNGEIFNYIELREELLAKGHRFRTHSDTEVIVHAFEEWGDEAFGRFNGQFAVALWDRKARRLTLARDPLGVRPLHYAEHDGRLWFASEVKAIFAGTPGFPRRLDPLGIDQTFHFWTVVAPATPFSGVFELPPGHIRTYDATGVTERSFWQPRFPTPEDPGFRGSLPEATEAVREALERATSLRMLRADVPVGSYLSGGLDSSLVAALGWRAKGGERFKTFSLRFADAEYDETPFQRLMVDWLGSDHSEVVVSREDIAAAFPAVVFHAERPMLRTAPAPLFLLSGLVRRGGIKVVLTGEGADEMFAGYDLFREAKVRRFWAREPASTARPRLLEKLYPYLARSPVSQQAMARQFFGRELERWREPGFGHAPRWRSASALRRLFTPAWQDARTQADVVADLLADLPREFPLWSFLAQDQYLEIRTLLSGYLLATQGDRMLMGHSVEGRFPFLDAEVVALANSLPHHFKLRVLDEKHILKQVAGEAVPPEILSRPKQPYRAPDAWSFTGAEAREWVDEVLSPRAVGEAGVFDPVQVGRLWNKCLSRPADQQFSQADNMALVGVLSTQLLHRQLLRDPLPPAPAFSWTVLVEK